MNILLAISNIVGTVFCGISAFLGIANYYGWKPAAGTESMVAWVMKPFLIVIIFLIGIALLASPWIIFYRIWNQASAGATAIKSDTQIAKFADSAELTLHLYSDERTPTSVSLVNIWRWYYLRNIFVAIDKETGKEHKRVISNLFITFDTPVKIGTLQVQSPDLRLPLYEVKEFTNRYAIIVFTEELPAGTLVITIK